MTNINYKGWSIGKTESGLFSIYTPELVYMGLTETKEQAVAYIDKNEMGVSLAKKFVERYQDIDGMVWDWADQTKELGKETTFETNNKQPRDSRYLFGDGSTIVCSGDGWDFGFTEQEIESGWAKKLMTEYGSDNSEDDPRFFWPETIGISR